MILRFVVFFLIAASILGWMHVYVAWRLWSLGPWPFYAGRVGIAGFILLAVSVFVAMALSHGSLVGKWWADTLIVVGFAWMGMLWLLLAATLIGDIAALIARPVKLSPETIRWARLFCYGVALMAGFWALREGQRLPRVREIPVMLEQLPPAFDGYRIAHISDTHIGPVLRGEWAKELVRLVNDANPDLIAHTGDLADGRVQYVGRWARELSALKAKDGVFFVSGNHEIYSHSASWIEEIRSWGWIPLMNQHRLIERTGRRIAIGGIPDRQSAHLIGEIAPSASQAFANAPAPQQVPRILLAHQPVQARDARGLGIALQLSGHTHGGQIWPFHGLIPLQQPVLSGFSRIGDILVFTSRGAGFWGPPMRLFAPAEIPVLILRSPFGQRT